MRVAWFSPLPPVRSGIAAYSAELLPRLAAAVDIDGYPESAAHDFVWRHRRDPYDLVVYQLGNAPCHDYMWAYLVRYPGLVVLHDARLHHARARALLQARRADDYRREFTYDHPDARPDVAEYAVQGLGGSINYFWPMRRVVLRTARTVAVHNARVAADLANDEPGAAIETIRMGVPAPRADPDARRRVRIELGIPGEAIAFAAFGKVTREKRIPAMLQALGRIACDRRDVYLLLVGDRSGYAPLDEEIARHGIADRVRVTGHVADAAVGDHLAAADACLCLRWPTALETSASWLRCLAAGRPTAISDLPHLVDVPPEAALRVDLLDEEASLERTMRALVEAPQLREDLGRAGQRHWAAHHTLEAMADDYRRVLAAAADRAAPRPADLPPHFVEDGLEPARAIARRFGVEVDVLRAGGAG
jgi:glycosyltransferase involved in cell wall biosynthesis